MNPSPSQGRRVLPVGSGPLWLLTLTALLLPGEDLGFPMRGGFGWAGTLPDALLGAAGFYMFQGNRWGVYVDAKIPHDSLKRSANFQGNLTIAQVESEFPANRRIPIFVVEEWRLFNVGFVRPLTEETAIVLGGGVAHFSAVQEYSDEGEMPLTRSGFYFVEDELRSGWEPNLLVSAMFRVGTSIAFNAGFEWAPKSFTFALLYTFQ